MEMDKLTDSEMIEVLEIAKFALADADIFDEVADMLDISDNSMNLLRDKIDNALGE